MSDLNADEVDALACRLARIEEAIQTMAAWLVEAQTGFGVDDYLGIVNILKPGDNPAAREAGSRKVDQ